MLRHISLFTILLLLTLFAAACGGGETAAPTPVTPAPATPEAPPPTEAGETEPTEAEAADPTAAPAVAVPEGQPVFDIVMTGYLEGEGGYNDQGFGRRPEYLVVRRNQYQFRVRAPFAARQGFLSARMEAQFAMSTEIEPGTYPLVGDASAAEGTEAVYLQFGSANPNDPRFDLGEGEITITEVGEVLSAEFEFAATRRGQPENVVNVSGEVRDLPIP
jgi:hypothetical protein